MLQEEIRLVKTMIKLENKNTLHTKAIILKSINNKYNSIDKNQIKLQ